MHGETLLSYLDTRYAYSLAKRMEEIKSNPVLGYRTAGSVAERQTGDMLAEEMRRIGLQNVRKDAIQTDAWEFHHAILAYTDAMGRRREVQLGAYQTQLVTDGFESLQMVYLGKGTAADYAGKDVRGKLVLVDINQRDEWWISYPVYQAHLMGARALIAVQSGGYGEVDEEALNAQDIGGPENAPAFSISRRDAMELRALMVGGELTVQLSADTRVTRDQTTYNIVGEIPGRHPERLILFSAHYDSYFCGFQDDNTAIAMMLGIARALVLGGYQPENTLVFCCMAAEEWGVADNCFDWSTGAWEQVFIRHPEWAGKVVANMNFELPALAHGTRARVRSCYEYVHFLKDFLGDLPALTQAYPEEAAPTAPIETWSDDFSIAISGIPSLVNDFTGGSFMETNYHSQFDNDDYYDEQVYRLHHELFLLLCLAFDHTCVAPLCFTPVLRRAAECLEELPDELPTPVRSKAEALLELLRTRMYASDAAWHALDKLNQAYAQAMEENDLSRAEEIFRQTRALEAAALARFKAEQDAFVRIDWYGNVSYPHELLFNKLHLLHGAIRNLRGGHTSSALRKLYQVDNNAYAFMFDKEVYHHFTDSVLRQPWRRSKWCYGRLVGHEDLYALVTSLLRKEKEGVTDFTPEIAALEEAAARQLHLLSDTLDEMTEVIRRDFDFTTDPMLDHEARASF
mgnify:CR=1 FL=1